MEQGGLPMEGQWFCLGGNRSYLISDAEQDEFGNWRLNFIPPLRAPAFVTDRVDFVSLYCSMNQTKDDQGITILDGMKFTTLEWEFTEAFEQSDLVSGSETG
jgi:hypothetical protein